MVGQKKNQVTSEGTTVQPSLELENGLSEKETGTYKWGPVAEKAKITNTTAPTATTYGPGYVPPVKKRESFKETIIKNAIALTPSNVQNTVTQGVTGFVADLSRTVAVFDKATLDLFKENNNKDVTEMAAYKFADWLDKTSKELAPVDEKARGTIVNQLVDGGTSLGLFALGGYVSKGLKGAAFLVPTTMGAMQNGGATHEEAYLMAKDAHELSDEEYLQKYSKEGVDGQLVLVNKQELMKQEPEQVAWEAFLPALAVGTLDGIPIATFLNRVDKATGGTFKKVLSTKVGQGINNFYNKANSTTLTAGLLGGTEEAIQESFTATLNNLNARDIYDKTREIYEGVSEAGGIGGVLGFTLNALGVSLKQRRLNPANTQEDNNAIDAASKLVEEKIETLKDVKENDFVPGTDSEQVSQLKMQKDKLALDIAKGNLTGAAKQVIEKKIQALDGVIEETKTKEANEDFKGKQEKITKAETDVKIAELQEVLKAEDISPETKAAVEEQISTLQTEEAVAPKETAKVEDIIDEAKKKVENIVAEQFPSEETSIVNNTQELTVEGKVEAEEQVPGTEVAINEKEGERKTGVFINTTAHAQVGEGMGGLFGKKMKNLMPEFITKTPGKENNSKENDTYEELTEGQANRVYENLLDQLDEAKEMPDLLAKRIESVKTFLDNVGTEQSKAKAKELEPVLENIKKVAEEHANLKKQVSNNTAPKDWHAKIKEIEKTFSKMDLADMKGDLFESQQREVSEKSEEQMQAEYEASQEHNFDHVEDKNELASLYDQEVKTLESIPVKERYIAEALTSQHKKGQSINNPDRKVKNTVFKIAKVEKQSFIDNDDANNITANMARSYFAPKGKGRSLDVIADEINSTYFDGREEVNAEDIATFMKRYEGGAQELETKKGNPRLKAINDRYKALTGKDLNKKIARDLAKKYGHSEQKVVDTVSTEAFNLIAEFSDDNGNIDWDGLTEKLNSEPGYFTNGFPDFISKEELTYIKTKVNDKDFRTRVEQEISKSEENGDTVSSNEEGSQGDEGGRTGEANTSEIKGTDKFISFLDDLIDGIDNNAFSDPFLLTATARAGLKIVKQVYIATKNITEAIAKGIEYIKANLKDGEQFNEEGFKTLFKEQQAFDSFVKTGSEILSEKNGNVTFPEFREEFLNRVNGGNDTTNESINEIYTEASRRFNDNKKNTASTKNTINKNTGVVKDVAKVITNQYELLKKRLRDEARGAKGGYKAGKLEAKELAETFSNKIKEILSNADIRSKISPIQFQSLVNKARKVKSIKDVDRFEAYLNKVIENENYSADLFSAKSKRKTIARKIKAKSKGGINNKFPNEIEAVKAFLKINPAEVDDIAAYLEIADQISKNQKSASVKIVDGQAIISNGEKSITSDEIIKYTEGELKKIEQKKKDQLATDYKDLVDQGLIDPAKMSLQDMTDVIEATQSTDEEFDNILADLTPEETEVKREAMQSFVDYKLTDLERYLAEQNIPLGDGTINNTLSKEEKTAVANILSIDTSQLTIKELAKLNDVIENITKNDNFSGAGVFDVISEAQRDVKELKDKASKSKFSLGSIKNAAIQGLASKNLMFEFITKSTKLAAEFQRLMGVSDIFNGNAKAKNLQGKLMDEYTKLKDSLSKDIDSSDNRYRRGVYARVIQHFGGDERSVNAEFIRTKKLVKESFENLKKSDIKEEVAEGEAIEKAYNELLEGSNNAEDVRNKLNNLNPGNAKVVEFFQAKFDDRVDLLEQSATLYNNEAFEGVVNYTATKMKGYSGADPIADAKERDIFEQKLLKKSIDSKESKTKITRRRIQTLSKGMVLDLDFDKVQTEKYFESNYDIETQRAIHKLKHILNNKDAKDILGGSENLTIITKSLANSVMLQKGNVTPPEIIEKRVVKALNILQAKGARIALGSVSQTIKQYPSVAVSTIINLGTDAGLFFKALTVPNNIQLFDKFNIGNRGDTQAGLNKEVNIDTADKASFNTAMGNIADKISKAGQVVGEGVMKALVTSDVSIARTSWIAYYMQDLAKRGVDISSIDWKNEHNNPSEEAAAYAEQMVSRTQNANDASSMANLYNNIGSGWGSIVKNLFLPFNSFGLNQRMRMTNDMQKLLFGGDKLRAARSLTATMGEQVAFNYIKVYVIGSLVAAGSTAVLKSFGFDDEEDEKKDKTEAEKIKSEKAKNKFVANIVSDYFYGGLGSMTSDGITKGLNYLHSLFSDDPKSQLIYQYDPKFESAHDFSRYGVYGTVLTQAGELYKNRLEITGKTNKIKKGGFKEPIIKEVEITENEKNLARLNFLITGLGIIGLSDADLLRMNNQINTKRRVMMERKYGTMLKVEIATKAKGKY